MTPEQSQQLEEIRKLREQAEAMGRDDCRRDHDGRDWPPGQEGPYCKAYHETFQELFRSRCL
mgnify:CR=1 FL=1